MLQWTCLPDSRNLRSVQFGFLIPSPVTTPLIRSTLLHLDCSLASINVCSVLKRRWLPKGCARRRLFNKCRVILYNVTFSLVILYNAFMFLLNSLILCHKLISECKTIVTHLYYHGLILPYLRQYFFSKKCQVNKYFKVRTNH